MPPSFTHVSDVDHIYHVTPDETDRLVEELHALNAPALNIDTFLQYTGRKVYALTFNDPESNG